MLFLIVVGEISLFEFYVDSNCREIFYIQSSIYKMGISQGNSDFKLTFANCFCNKFYGRYWSTYHIFKLIQNIYNLTNFHIFESRNPKTKMFGENNTADKPSQLWKHNPEEDKNSILFSSFIESIKNFPFICCLFNCCKK